MAALLVGLSVMAVLMSMAMPVWSQFTRREREEELIWRGNQYARAIGLFQRKFANTFPPTIDMLVEQRFLRKKYKDPITGEDFLPIPAGGAVNPGQTVDPRNPTRQGAGPPSRSARRRKARKAHKARLRFRARCSNRRSGFRVSSPRARIRPSRSTTGAPSTTSGPSSISRPRNAFSREECKRRACLGGSRAPGAGREAFQNNGAPLVASIDGQGSAIRTPPTVSRIRSDSLHLSANPRHSVSRRPQASRRRSACRGGRRSHRLSDLPGIRRLRVRRRVLAVDVHRSSCELQFVIVSHPRRERSA